MDKEKKEEDGKKGPGSSADPQNEKKQDRDSVSTNSYSSLEIESKDRPSTAAHLGARKLRMPKKKKHKRATGRVQKRKPRKTKRRPTRPRYINAATPSATSFSSRNTLSLRNMTCQYCGHRCCIRRFMAKKRPLDIKYQTWKLKRTRVRKRNCRLGTSTVSMSCQMGPPSLMLSKLYVASSPTAEEPKCQAEYREISPEMIHHTLQDLSMWRQEIPLDLIFEYIRKHYPVNPNKNEAMEELMEKLRVAQIAGIVWALPYNCWRLPTALEHVSRLEMTHVTLFWRAYWDTMKPLDKNRQRSLVKEDKQAGTEETLRIRDDTDRLDII